MLATVKSYIVIPALPGSHIAIIIIIQSRRPHATVIAHYCARGISAHFAFFCSAMSRSPSPAPLKPAFAWARDRHAMLRRGVASTYFLAAQFLPASIGLSRDVGRYFAHAARLICATSRYGISRGQHHVAARARDRSSTCCLLARRRKAFRLHAPRRRYRSPPFRYDGPSRHAGACSLSDEVEAKDEHAMTHAERIILMLAGRPMYGTSQAARGQ